MRHKSTLLPLLAVALLLIAAIIINSSPSQAATQTVRPTDVSPTIGCQSWTNLANFPQNITRNAVVSLNGYLYSFGGNINALAGADAKYHPAWSVGNHVYRYDGSAWVQLADMPIRTWLASAVTDGQYIYIFGGEDGNVNHLYRYAPSTDTYTALAIANVHTYAQGAAYLNGKIYRIGGVTGFAAGDGILPDNYAYTNSVEVYDIATNIWNRVADYPMAVGFASVAAINGYVYVAGGNGGYMMDYNDAYRYDPATNTWDDAAIADLPVARTSAAAAIYNGRFVVAGGDVYGYQITNSVLAWNPTYNTWSSLPLMEQPSENGGAAMLNGSFYVLGGGATSNGGTSNVQQYQSSCPSETPVPTVTGTPPTATPTRTTIPTHYPSPSPTFCTQPFTDLRGNVFLPAITQLYCRGAVGGTSANTYSPAGNTTRAQFARVIVRAFDLVYATPTGGVQSFSDVPSNYYAYGSIETAVMHGVLGGYSQQQCADGGATYPCFMPNRPISRAELVRLVVRAAGCPRTTPTTPTFSDVPPSYFAYINIETAYAHNLVRGTDGSHFSPNRAVRRDEMAGIVFKGMTMP